MTDAHPPISAYIRTLNEERMIGDVVRAAFQIAREVIVVDSGSTDRTIPIAEAAGAKIIRHEWLGVGHQKRIGEDACAHDWLLDLDADEIITPALAQEIKAHFANGAPRAEIFRTMLALAPSIGRPWRNFGLYERHKLYDRRAVRAPAHAAWDQFKIPPGARIALLREPVLHYSFDGVAAYIDKLNRYSTARAKDAPRKSRPYLALRICFGLPVYFFKELFIRQFIRGGVYGVAIATLAAFGRWMRDVKMWELSTAERKKK